MIAVLIMLHPYIMEFNTVFKNRWKKIKLKIKNQIKKIPSISYCKHGKIFIQDLLLSLKAMH